MKYWTKYIANILIIGTLFTAIYTAGEYVFYKTMPTSYWFEYHDIKPTQLEFVGEEPRFNTYYTFHREFDGQALHQLKCNQIGENNRFAFYSDQTNDFGIVSKKENVSGIFTYSEHKPEPPRVCFLRSEIRAILPYGIVKTQVITGELFKIL